MKPLHNVPMGSLDFVAILHEMDNSDNRTCAIVAAALIENNLATAISARLRLLDAKEQKKLFEDRGVLATFSAKIDIGFALNIYDGLVRHDLDQIRSIRNRFAHYLEVRDFDHPDVASFCDGLHGSKHLTHAAGREVPANRKERFLDVAAHLGARFDIEKKNESRPPEPVARVVPEY
jgi:hypothetical protein